MDKRIHLCLARMSDGENEKKYITEAFDSNWVTSAGPNVEGFEGELARYFGDGKHVVAVSSGTAAIHLALILCGVTRGDEVFCQSFTFCASSNPIVYLGATPVFVDSDLDTWNMDPDLLEEALKERVRSSRKLPKAIIVVHLYGMPAKINRISEIARSYHIPLIEDAAEAMGSAFRGKLCGTWGDYGIVSFNGNKMITTSGGGALICPSEEAKEHAKHLATQAREALPYYQHEVLGYNYRMSNICAGIGRGQMTVLEQHVRHHRRIADFYKSRFSSTDAVEFHEEMIDSAKSNFWLSTILIDPHVEIRGKMKKQDDSADFTPNENILSLIDVLNGFGVETRALWKPLHLQPIYAKNERIRNGVSEDLFRRGLCLPSGPCVTIEDADYVASKIIEHIY